jgi:hypothetical protein
MTQKIFDTDNAEDMALLWSILPDMVKRIEKEETNELNPYHKYMAGDFCLGGCCYINIDFHDKTEITRPIQEATEQDIGKLCAFWNDEDVYYGKLGSIRTYKGKIYYELKTHIYEDVEYLHCRRLTKKEIEELC